MKNLGKILLTLFLTPLFLHADVKAYVDTDQVSLGDIVTLKLTIMGEDVQKPKLFAVCDSDIISTSSQTSIQMINLDYKKSYTLSYQFMPKKSCVIEPIEIIVDGKVEKTEPVKIKVSPVSKRADTNFELTLMSSKQELFVGEPFDVELLFKQKRSAEALDSKFLPPEFKGFWVKGETQPQRYEQGAYIMTKLSYRLAAQREGNLEISPAQMSIASRGSSKDLWGSWSTNVKWKSYFSNDLNISVKPLPEGASLVGDFTIKASADKSVINPNEAVNVTIEVVGDGNLEDIKSFKPFITGVSVFDEKIAIESNKLTQKIAFVADGNFTIEPFTLSYFDLKEQKIKSITTEALNIEVKGGATAPSELLVKRDESNVQTSEAETSQDQTGSISLVMGLSMFIGGLLLGLGVMLTQPWKYFKREKSISIKEPKILLMKLLPYKEDAEVQDIMNILEKNIYANEKTKIDKEKLKEILKKYEIS
ncbi:BatD family protein [bacterium]|nr:BatD family protein [bacterium]